MDFRRRPGPDEPNAQIFEDVPDDRRVFDGTDDPHGPLTFRTNQRIDLVDLPLLMAGGAKMATLAGKGRQIFMTAVFAFHTGKAVVRIAAIEIAKDHLLY